MGKIADYANVLKSKLTDLFVVYQRNNGELETKNATLEQLGDAICGEQVHSDLKTDNQTIIGSINELAKDKNVADEYDDTQTYDKGDVVIYKNTLYICTTNNTTGTWDATKWTATTIDNVIGDLSDLTTSVTSSLVGAVNEIDAELSNKADKALTEFNLTAGTGITLQHVNCFAFGNLKVISLTIVVGSDATTIIATVPSGYSASKLTFFYLGKDGGSGTYGYITGIRIRTDSVLSPGQYIINFVYR